MSQTAAEARFAQRVEDAARSAAGRGRPTVGRAVVVDIHTRARRVVDLGPGSDAAPTAAPAHDSAPEPSSSVEVLCEVGRSRARLDADLLSAVAGVVAVCEQGVLVGLGLPRDTLTATRRDRVLADTKRRAVSETSTALGMKVGEARTLVSLAMADPAVLDTVTDALSRGETSWPQLRRFWDMTNSTTRDLSEDQKVLVATALFGTDQALAAVERLDEDGRLQLGTPWPQAPFEAALTREVTACEGTDVTAERERRRRAYAARRASVRVHDDGTGTFSVRGPLHKVLAAHARHDDVARSLRGAGHPDSLAQLAADSVLATLTHGTLAQGCGSDIDELSEADLEDLIAVVNGHPRIALQVIVPADVLGLGYPVCATCADDLTADHEASNRSARINDRVDIGDGQDSQLPFDQSGDPPSWARPTDHGQPDQANVGDAEDQENLSDQENPPDHQSPPADQQDLRPDQEHARGPAWGFDPELRRGRGRVAEIIGSHPAFITPGMARELFYAPGTTLHRLVTDPADGRCVERSIRTYRPDSDMRRQVRAADVYSRHPHSRSAGRALEIDHVIPFGTGPSGTGPGGTTTETNLANLDLRNHKIKTVGELTIAINTRRDLTFTTMLGQISRSRTHDYRQYLRTAHPEDLEDQRDLANITLYAALANRPEHRCRPGPDTWLVLDHTDPATGQTHPGPPEHPADPHDLLGVTDQEDE